MVQTLASQDAANFGGSDIGTELEDILHLDFIAGMCVMNDLAADLVSAALAVNPFAGGNQLFLKSRSQYKGLERGTGFEAVADHPVTVPRRIELTEGIGVKGRVVGHCQNLAAGNFHYHRAPCLGTGVFNAKRQLFFQNILKVLVQRQPQIVALVTALHNEPSHSHAASPGVDSIHNLPGLSHDLLVVKQFQPFQAPWIEARKANNLRSHRRVGVIPAIFRHKTNSGNLHGPDIFAFPGRNLPFQPNKITAGFNLAPDFLEGKRQMRGQSLGHRRIHHLTGIDIDRIDIDAQGQFLSTAVVDGAALGNQGDSTMMLVLRLVLQTFLLKNLKIAGTRYHCGEKCHKHHADDDNAVTGPYRHSLTSPFLGAFLPDDDNLPRFRTRHSQIVGSHRLYPLRAAQAGHFQTHAAFFLAQIPDLPLHAGNLVFKTNHLGPRPNKEDGYGKRCGKENSDGTNTLKRKGKVPRHRKFA